MKPLTVLALLVACSVGIGTADARSHSRNSRRSVDLFKKLDKNHNGTLSPEEFAAGGKRNSAAKFASLDKNHDGKLDRYEFSLMNKRLKP